MTRSGEATRVDVAVAHDLFYDMQGNAPDKEVTISADSLDFGCQTVGGSGERKRTVTVNNGTRAKICVVWKKPPVPNGDCAGPDFSISPESVDIADGASFDFKVSGAARRPGRPAGPSTTARARRRRRRRTGRS
jgi:hypothetical protein